MTTSPQATALAITQQAILLLSHWSNSTLAYQPTVGHQSAIQQAKTWIGWPNAETQLAILQLVFDTIALSDSTSGERYQASGTHYTPAIAIADTWPTVVYPVEKADAIAHIAPLKTAIKSELDRLTESDWQNLSLLTLLLEKYGSYISYGEPDVSFFDRVKMTAAVAAALVENPSAETLCLVAGDLSGIQSFIYTISSAGALKSLRARSFLLELVTEEIVRQLLEELNLPRACVIYAGGGNLFILAPSSAATEKTVARIRQQFNNWLLDSYQGKLFLGLASHSFRASEVATETFSSHWNTAIKLLAKQKNRKFIGSLERLLAPQSAHEPCKVCHRDDTKQLKPLDGDGPDACPTCRDMLKLGRNLYNVGAVVRSSKESLSQASPIDKIKIEVGGRTAYYHFFQGKKPLLTEPEDIYLINNWTVSLYKEPAYQNPTLLLLGNYGQKSTAEPNSFITAAEMASTAQGISRVGHLRMDVDRLGQIFATGLGNQYTLPRLSGLSRQMSYFFKGYLSTLADDRDASLPKGSKQLTTDCRKDLLFIYAGGDDLFVSGAWDDLVEFSLDVYQSFRAYTGYHPGITLSGGLSLCGPKYPLYQSAEDAGKAESTAKKNGRDSLTLFDQTFKWQAWIGHSQADATAALTEGSYHTAPTPTISQELEDYIGDAFPTELYGIMPFVSILQSAFQQVIFPKSFVRNLLVTANMQEQQIKALTAERSADAKDIRYYLHLPKVAYTLARLPRSIRAAPDFEAVARSLKSPYNAPYFRAIATWLDLLSRNKS